jgi:hypothetical protein
MLLGAGLLCKVHGQTSHVAMSTQEEVEVIVSTSSCDPSIIIGLDVSSSNSDKYVVKWALGTKTRFMLIHVPAKGHSYPNLM